MPNLGAAPHDWGFAKKIGGQSHFPACVKQTRFVLIPPNHMFSFPSSLNMTWKTQINVW